MLKMLTDTGFLFLSLGVCHAQEKKSVQAVHPAFNERREERERMVHEGIRNYPFQPVRDKEVLEAMRRVPRHAFVPEEYQSAAYRNAPLPIGNNQTISQPYIVAHMTELLEIEPTHRVLEIGTGSGYQAAVLAELCREVYSIEIIPVLGMKATELLEVLGYANVHVRIGDGYEGWPEKAPFDRIIVTAAPDEIPEPLVAQLVNGGRIIIPVGEPHRTQYLVLVTKDEKGRISEKTQYPVRFVPMTGKAEEKKP